MQHYVPNIVICESFERIRPLKNHECWGGGLPRARQSKETVPPSSILESLGFLINDTGSFNSRSVDIFNVGPNELVASHV